MSRDLVVPTLALPRGLVTVELADADTGRIAYRETKENFLSAVTTEFAEWFQRFMWGAYNPVRTLASTGFDPINPPNYFPAKHLAYWNESAAEDSANERYVTKPVVGYASRQPLGSPTGKRGVVNITESELTDTYSKWVFDWTTSQGNGTFQSVGWTMISPAAGGNPIGLWPVPGIITLTHSGTNGSSGYPGYGLWHESSSFYTMDWDSGGSQHRLKSFAEAGGAGSLVFNVPTTAWQSSSGKRPAGICRIGTDWYMVGKDSSAGYPRVTKINSSGTQQYATNRTDIAGGHGFTDVTTDGTYLYAACSDGKVYRLVASDGSISATITPADLASMGPLGGIAWDGTDLYVHASTWRALVKIDTSGNTLGPIAGYSSGYEWFTATSPYTGSCLDNVGQNASPAVRANLWSDASGAQNFAGDLITSAGNTAPAATNFDFAVGNVYTGTYYAPLTYKGTDLWAGHTTTNGGVLEASPVTFDNLASRVRLSSPVTKTSSQTLKITYQLDF